MAGLGEVCLHIAAILFLMKANTSMENETTCTSLPCYWLPPTMQNVTFAPVAEIDLKRQKIIEDLPQSAGDNTAKISSSSNCVPTDEELNEFYENLSNCGKPAILSIISGYSEAYIPLQVKGAPPLTEVFTEEYLEASYTTLLEKCEETFNGINQSFYRAGKCS